MKKVLIPIIIVLILAGGGFAVWHTLQENVFSAETFPQKTIINKVDCSGLTANEAEEKLTETWNSNSFTFTSKGSELGTIKDLNFTYAIHDSLSNLKKEHFLKAAANHFFKSDFDVEMDMPVKKVNKSFQRALKNADYLKEKDIVKTKDAYIDVTTEDFQIVPEVYGNNVDYKALTEAVTKSVAGGKFEMEYVTSKFYEKPEITEDSDEIKKQQEVYREYLTSKISYIFGNEAVKIPPEDMEKMLELEINQSVSTDEDAEDGEKSETPEVKVSVNEEAVSNYVDELAQKYNTLGKTRRFKSLSGQNIEVSGGDYGYAIDREKEAKQLTKDLKKGKKVSREPEWLMTGFTEYSQTDDIGDTYVDISLSEQHLWYFKNGKKLVDTPVVTGTYQVYDTPTGTFGLSYKQQGATLRGSNADGSSYESPVSYWMPFYGNYGMHDAPWRSSFGGSIYRGGGSHGCVNMPIPAAKKLFENLADKNVPVIVHW